MSTWMLPRVHAPGAAAWLRVQPPNSASRMPSLTSSLPTMAAEA